MDSAPFAPHEFELARTEERWIVEEGAPRLIELRADRGACRTGRRGDATIVSARSLPSRCRLAHTKSA